MPSSFIGIRKGCLTTHYNACRPFLLLGSWASLAAFSLMLICIYPFPVTVMELATIFLKLLLLSNTVVLAVYLFVITVKLIGQSCIIWLRNKAKVTKAADGRSIPELFPYLHISSSAVLAESVLRYDENLLQPL